MLSDAGLLDVVAEVIREHPEASAVIYGTPPSEPPSLDARFTTDGMTWEPVDVTLPAGVMYLSSVTTVGDRLVVAYSPQSPNSASPPDTAVVATTTDLVNWTTQVIPTSGPDIELPPEIMRSVSAQGLVANERGWAITVFESTEPDVLALIPAEDRARIEADNSGYGVSFDDAGIQVDLAFSDTGTATETLEYTWAELGIAPEVAEYLGGNQYEPRVWAATWDGTPSVSTDAPWSDQLLATPAGFVQFTDRTLFSTDGLSWTASPLPDPDGVVTASFAFDGGVIALSDSGDGATVYRLDERGGSPELLDLSDLPAQVRSGFSPQSPSRSAVIVDVLDPEARPEPRVVEFEGYRVTVDDLLGRYEVVETATGDIVASERVGATGFAEGSNLAFDADGLVVTDPTTGDVVVAIPHEALYAAPSDAPGDAGWSEYLPDLWLLASVDGEHFVVDDLVDDVAAEDGFGGPVVLVANDDQLLVNLGGAWLHYDLS
jgi:hypothetical protein